MKNIELIAATCHQVNKAYCEATGDYSQSDWLETSDMIRKSVMSGVEVALANPDATPEQMHESWSQYKLAEGWVYGLEKDLDKKTHPNLVPYDALPEAQRKKDWLFLKTVDTMWTLLQLQERE